MTEEDLENLAAKIMAKQAPERERTVRQVVRETPGKTDWRGWIASGIAVGAALGTLGFFLFASAADFDTHVKLAKREQAVAKDERTQLTDTMDALRHSIDVLNTNVAVLNERLPRKHHE